MEKQEFIQRMSMLQTESDEFIETYIKKIYECASVWDAEKGESIHLRYQGSDIDVVKRLFMKYCEMYFPDFIIDSSNRSAIDYLLNMSIYRSAKQGLIVRGNIGTGKTFLVILFINFIQHVLHGSRGCRYYNPINITADYMSKGFDIFNRENGYILIIDDLGINTESIHYGNKINVIEHLIYARYEQFKLNPAMQIICTTNLVYKDMLELYGERAMSRLTEMAEWNEGAIIGTDRRKVKSLKSWPKNTYLNNQYIMP